MENLITKPTEISLRLLREYISEGDTVIDATAGNGYDTLALARLTGRNGKVYGFDVQETAIENTKALLEREGFPDTCELIRCSHHLMKTAVPEQYHGKISAVVFNLGYLPGGDKRKMTGAGTTLPAVRQALELIRPDGIVSITMYGGHPEGAAEKEELLRFAKELPQREYHSVFLSLINQKNRPPELLLLTRKPEKKS